jgi:hypothetical protein
MSYDNLSSVSQNNSGTAKVKIIKNERDPPLFTGKLLIKFQNILRNTTLHHVHPSVDKSYVVR